MIINAEDLILGRLANFAAKKSLLGEEIIIINSEKAIITGSKKLIEAKYKHRKKLIDPFQGPFYPHRPDRLVRRTIRGMLPWKRAKGREAYRRVMCYIGIPEKFKDEKITWASIEHNLDAYFLLKNMEILTHDPRYKKAKDLLKEALLSKAWNEKEGQFNRGVRKEEIDSAMALDCASWGILFLLSIGEKEKARQAMNAMERYFIQDPIRGVWGYRPYYAGFIYDEMSINKLFYPHWPQKSWSDIPMVWSEGSLGVAMAYLKMGEKEKAKSILEEISKMQMPSGGFQYATQEIPFQFSPSPSMAGTAWFAMVALALENETLLKLFWD